MYFDARIYIIQLLIIIFQKTLQEMNSHRRRILTPHEKHATMLGDFFIHSSILLVTNDIVLSNVWSKFACEQGSWNARVRVRVQVRSQQGAALKNRSKVSAMCILARRFCETNLAKTSGCVECLPVRRRGASS